MVSARTVRGGRLAAACVVALTAQLALAGGASANTFEADGASLGPIPDGTSTTPGTFGSLPSERRDVTFTVPNGTFASGSPTKVAITFSSDHTYVGDLDVVLIAPNGEDATVFSRTGAPSGGASGDFANLGGPYTFTDLAPAAPTWWQAAAGTSDVKEIPGGSYRASAAGPSAGPNTSLTSEFVNVPNMNGTWTLRVRDGASGDTGSITAASLELLGAMPPAAPGFLGPIPDGSANLDLDVPFSITGLTAVPPSSLSTSMTFSPPHSYAGDLEVTLIAPNGAQATIFSRTGDTTGGPGDASDLAGPYSFLDGALGNWWNAAAAAGDSAAIPSGSYRTSSPGGVGGTGAVTSLTSAFSAVTDPNGTWTLRFRDRLAADTGGVGAASLRILSGTDSTAPIAPSLGVVTNPASPSNSSAPKIQGNTEAGSTVRLYSNATCSGLPAATGSAAALTGSEGIPFPVAADGATDISATAYDASGNVSGCSNAISYTRDTVAPATPALSTTDPAPPADNHLPKFKGTTDPGTAVKFYESGDCTGPVAVTGTAAALNGVGIEVEVPEDSATTLRVTATDEAGNASGCSNPITYVEDSTAPATPILSATDPGGAANQNAPKVRGSAEAGAQVRLFASADCAGAPIGTGSAGDLGGAGVTASVPDDATTQIRATATDVAGHASACSAPIAFTEDSKAPETSAITLKRKVTTKKKTATVRFVISSPEAGVSFECRVDTASLAACGTSVQFRLKKGKHTLEAVAIDAAGNRDPSPARVSVKVKRKKR